MYFENLLEYQILFWRRTGDGSKPRIPYFWVNYNDLTATSLESWLGFEKSSPNGLSSD
jgi:hypothetical protein